MLQFLKPYKKWIILMPFLLSVQVIGIPYIPTLTADIINDEIVVGSLSLVRRTGGFMLLTAMITALVPILDAYTSTHIPTSIGRGIHGVLFRKVQDFSASDFQQLGAASLITRSTNDVAQAQQTFSVVVEMLPSASFMTVAGLMLAFFKNRLLALTIVGFMPLVILFTLALGKKLIPIYGEL